MRALVPLNAWQATALVVLTIALVLSVLAILFAGVGWLVRWWRLRRAMADEMFHEKDPGVIETRVEERDGRLHKTVVRRAAAFRATPLQPAPARFIGWQDGMGTGLPPFELWHLYEAIPGHPKHDTLSRATLERLGYFVPPAPYQFGESATEAGFLAETVHGPAGSPSPFSQRKP